MCENYLRQFDWALTQINERDRIGFHMWRSTFNVVKFGFPTGTRVSGLSAHPSITRTYSRTHPQPLMAVLLTLHSVKDVM